MPELPEVESVVRSLREQVAGRTIASAIVDRPDFVRTAAPLGEALPGRRIIDIARRAKWIVFSLKPGGRLIAHLGMSGRITLAHESEAVEPHTHVRLGLSAGGQIRFRDPRRFGGVWFYESEGAIEQLDSLGMEPLTMKPTDLRQALDRKRRIKSLLMDQSVIAGLGNIYCDESLFAAGIHPLRTGASLSADESWTLLRAIRSILNRAIRFNGSTLMDYRNLDGEPGSFQRLHRVYQRDGKPCKRCGTLIERLIVNGRSTFVCNQCQRKRPHMQTVKRLSVPS